MVDGQRIRCVLELAGSFFHTGSRRERSPQGLLPRVTQGSVRVPGRLDAMALLAENRVSGAVRTGVHESTAIIDAVRAIRAGASAPTVRTASRPATMCSTRKSGTA